MSAHTPGPWRVVGHRQIATTAGAGLPICEVWSGGVGLEQAAANERLIAVAPELLGAAVLTLQTLRALSFDDFLAPSLIDDIDRLAGVIAKAEGRS